jgi:hypothetical protein
MKELQKINERDSKDVQWNGQVVAYYVGVRCQQGSRSYGDTPNGMGKGERAFQDIKVWGWSFNNVKRELMCKQTHCGHGYNFMITISKHETKKYHEPNVCMYVCMYVYMYVCILRGA